MKNSSCKIAVSLIGVLMVITLVAGCEEQNLANNKKSRLVATENVQLTELLGKCETELKNQKQLLADCQKEKVLAVEKTKKDAETLTSFVMEKNKDLVKENEELKAQLENLAK